LHDPAQCVTLSLMKTISIRELHETTGAWVREAARVGALLITDRGKPIARLEAVAEATINPFRARKLRPGYAKLRGKLGGGAESTQMIREDRDAR
jgi:antitoxin (DNA-binding transcriptional repressor) of toxin-antitoxin stability system